MDVASVIVLFAQLLGAPGNLMGPIAADAAPAPPAGEAIITNVGLDIITDTGQSLVTT